MKNQVESVAEDGILCARKVQVQVVTQLSKDTSERQTRFLKSIEERDEERERKTMYYAHGRLGCKWSLNCEGYTARQTRCYLAVPDSN
jgi:hypothetical protein